MIDAGLRRLTALGAAVLAFVGVLFAFVPSPAIADGVSPSSVAPASNAVLTPPATVTATYGTTLNTLAGASSLQVSFGGTAVAGTQSFTDSNRTIVFTPSTTLADGTYTATATVQELTVPPQSGTYSWSFTVDGTPPPAPTIDPVPIVSPSNEVAVTISGTESEADTAVQVSVNSSGSSPLAAAAQQHSDGTWSAAFNLSGLPDGSFGVTASASDPAGNLVRAFAYGTKDTIPPTPVGTTPADGAMVAGLRTVSVRWSEPIDPNSPSLSVQSAAGDLDPGTVAVSADGLTTTLTLQSLPTSAGNPWSITAAAADTAGNRATASVTHFSVEPPGAGTDVCGQLPLGTTIWSAHGAPYRICANGITVPGNAQLQLDGSQGPFAVLAAGSGGIGVLGGSMSTVNTDANDRVSFDSIDGGPWAGLSATIPDGSYDRTSDPGALTLSYLNIAHATTAVKDYWSSDHPGLTPDATLDHLTITGSTEDAVVAQYAPLTLTNSDIDTTAGRGIVVHCLTSGTDNATRIVEITGTTVTRAADEGIDLEYCPDPQLTNNTVSTSGLSVPVKPAIMVSSADPTYPFSPAEPMSLGTATGIAGNTGAGNGIDAIAVAGEQQGSFTWLTPTNSTSPHPLGYLNLGLHITGTGTATFPAGSVVKSGLLPGTFDDLNNPLRPGQLFLDGPELVASAGTVFTSLSDDSVGPSTCASALSESCVPTNTSWPGIFDLSGAVLTDTTIEHAEVGLRSQHFGTVWPDGQAVTGTGVTIQHCQMAYYGDDLSLTSSTVRDIHPPAIARTNGATVEWPGSAIWMEGSLSLHDVRISDVQDLGIHAEPTSSSKTLDLQNVSEDHLSAGLDVETSAFRTDRYDDPTITGLTITNSTFTAQINATDVQLGPGRHVDRLSGANNTHDAVSFTASFVGGFTWVTPSGGSDVHPLGYANDTYTLLGGALTVPPGATVTAQMIDLVGATLTAAPSAHLSISSLVAQDDAAGTPPSVELDGITWDNLSGFQQDSSSPMYSGIDAMAADANISITNSTLNGIAESPGVQGVSGAVFSGPVTLDHDTFTNVGLTTHGGTLTHSTLGTASAPALLTALGSAQLTLTDDVFEHSYTRALYLYGGTVEMDRVRITQSGNPQASTSSLAAAILLQNNSILTGSCNSITGNYAGLSTDSTSSATSNDSDIYANNGQNGYDVYAGGGPITVERVWWGQAGGPQPGQSQGAPVDARDPASSQAPAAVITTSSTATEPDGSYGTGTMTITLTFNRQMDTGVQPTVTLTGPDGRHHPIPGDWTSPTVWTGHYDISPSSASGGHARIDASDARSCINDPTTNKMSPANSEVTIDEPPAVSITSGPASGTFTGTRAAFAFTASSPATSYRCSLDGKATACTSPASYSNLTAGTHTFGVQATNSAGTGPMQTRTWTVDSGPPVARLTAPGALVQLGSAVTVSWTATDSGSGVASADVRYRRAAWNGTFGSYLMPSGWTGTTHTTLLAGIPAGYTYCFSMRAHDHVGNTSAWTIEHCTSRPLDDRSLTASSGWTRSTASVYYLGTVTKTTRAGVALARTQAELDRIALIATRCATCGVVDFYVNNILIGTVNTAGSLAYHVIFTIPRFSYRTGTVVLKTRSPARPVQIDALDLTRI